MTEEEKGTMEFDFSNVPLAWQLCFLDDCPRSGECLRRQAARHLTESRDWGPSVYPTMKRDERGCRLFAIGEPRKMAWGFKHLFEEVKRKHDTGLRIALKQYLGGHTAYYRYHHGKRLLTPEQQEWILELFSRYGYTENLQFEHYVYTYDFDH